MVCGLLFLVTTINYIDRSALGLVEPILKQMLGGDVDLALYNQHYSNIVTCFIVAYGLGFLCLATAAHQGWSSNLLSTPSDRFAANSVGTVVGIGGAMGAVGSTIFTTVIGVLWTHHALLIFFVAGFAYLIAMAAFQRKVRSIEAEVSA